ncbi:nodulation protein NfeD [Puteibacter caeruleilacunae]|nr:nodulation protein NfeD [Puteibacter caeruleilacunae]
MKIKSAFSIILALFTILTLHIKSFAAEDDTTLVYKFNIKQEIAPAIWRQTQQVLELAEQDSAELIIIHMNTYGGTVVDADSIRTALLNCKIPVYVFIDNNAASAGALISVACDSIFMSRGASIGAATVVNQTGQAMPDKYQSYMRSTMRSTAEAHGKDTIITATDTIYKWKRDPQIAEAMVDQSIYVAGISDTGKVLTFTPSEAIKHGFCEGQVKDIDEIIERSQIKKYRIEEYKPSGLEKLIGFLVHPMVSGILIMAIFGGIYFEMQTPGIGFPLAIAVLAAITYFAPLYLEGLAANWEIALFIVGLILIAVEIFVIPGFGIAGISGISLVLGGLILSLLKNVRFNFDGVDPISIAVAFATVIISVTTSFLLSLYLSQKIFTAKSGPLRNLALNATQLTNEGYIGIDTVQKSMKGKTGYAHTVLRPSGKVIIEGEIMDAKSEMGFIEKGEPIIVIRDEASQLYVEPFDDRRS